MNTKTVALVLVAVIIVAGIAVAVPSLMHSENEIEYGADQGRLLIYGNANKDDYINGEDIEELEAIIAGEKERTEFADANFDGVIDQKDIDMVKKMVDRKPMKIFYKDALTKSAEPIDYPVKNIVSATTESHLATKILGKIGNITGHAPVTDDVLYSDMPKVPEMGHFNGTGPVPLEAVSQIQADAVVTVGKPNAVTNETELEANGVPVIRFDFGATDPIPAYLTYGYIIDAEAKAKEYVKFIDSTLNDIKKKVDANVSEDEKKRGMVLGYNVIYGRISDSGNVIEMAGGINAVDWYEHQMCRDGYEWLYKYDFDYVIGNSNTGGYDYQGASENEKIKETYDKHYDRYEMTDAIQKGGIIILEHNMPVIAKAAYLAAEFYPDLFGPDYGDKVHQELVDRFLPNLKAIGYSVADDGLFAINPEVYKTL